MQIQLKKHHGRYSKYKQTELPWLDEVPEEWIVQKIKYITRMNPESLGEQTDKDYIFRYIDIGSVATDGKISGIIEIRFSDAPSRARRKVRKGDTIVATVRTYLKAIAYFDELEEDTVVSTGFAVLRATKGIDGKFLYYASRAEHFIQKVVVNSKGVNYPAITSSELGKLEILLPDFQVQKLIIDYLDVKIALVDLLIEAKQKQIELLKEKRSALINKAVTKGIDAGVEMKDSGVKWIGKIPKHWQEKPLFACAYEKKVKNTGNKIDKVLSLSYGQIVVRDVESNFGLLPESFETYQIVDAGDVILRLTDLQNDKKSLRVGLVKEVGIITSAYVCLRAKAALLYEYFYELLHSYDIEKVFYSLGAGVRQTMKFEDLKRLSVLIPPKEEQTRITHFIINETEKIDSAIVSIKRSVDLLGEYKTSLISNVITGKIKVT